MTALQTHTENRVRSRQHHAATVLDVPPCVTNAIQSLYSMLAVVGLNLSSLGNEVCSVTYVGIFSPKI